MDEDLTLRSIAAENWPTALELAVHPQQQRFVADYAPIAAVALAKAYVLAGGATWALYGIYVSDAMIGFAALAHNPEAADVCWVCHFFIDHRFQGRGYGKTALRRLVELVRRQYPECRWLRLVVHPENHVAQCLYTAAGFRPTGVERWGEPEYALALPAPN